MPAEDETGYQISLFTTAAGHVVYKGRQDVALAATQTPAIP